MNIFIDFDETLFPTLEKAIELYNKKYNDSLSFSQITAYNFYECLDVTTADKLVKMFTDASVYKNLQPYKGAVNAIKTIHERGNQIYIATATDVKNLEWKERLLKQYFPFIPQNHLIRIHNKGLLKADVLIEDNLDNLIQTSGERVCFNQVWNHNEHSDFIHDIYRIYHWGEIVNIINDIERKEA